MNEIRSGGVFQAAGFSVSLLTFQRAVSSTTRWARLTGDKTAYGTETSRRKARWWRLGREVVWRVWGLNCILFQKLSEVLSESGMVEFELKLFINVQSPLVLCCVQNFVYF